MVSINSMSRNSNALHELEISPVFVFHTKDEYKLFTKDLIL